ncbi:YdbL family protein [Azospirillum griseum]|uniref:DUF1318 domain-containing protein n=1 Tax=Azospirillum griseum TaxID=2496639 RepID=A0A3S0HYJ4_9PROT|nr:YdbL family protein [Azospirillum griseum]RTR21543.1 DUF1318 domain-containing protein [Azospirillum griseum]
MICRWFTRWLTPCRVVCAALVLLASGPSLAQDALSAAKAAGQMGERPDGLVGVVPGAPGAVTTLAAEINAQRLARYLEIARGNGTALDKVQAVAGEQLIARTPTGQFIMTPSGAWQRK